MSNEIEIIFNTDGTSTMKVNGVKGKSCKELTKPFEKALGITTDDKTTPEYFQPENVQTIKRS